MTSEDPPVDELRDAALHEEIELVGDLVVAATSTEGRLSQEEIDRLLQVQSEGPPARPELAYRPAQPGVAPGGTAFLGLAVAFPPVQPSMTGETCGIPPHAQRGQLL